MSKTITGDLSPAEILIRSSQPKTETEKKPKTESKAKKPAPKAEKPKRTYRVNLALRQDLGEAIKAEAEAQHRSVNNLIEILIAEYLERR